MNRNSSSRVSPPVRDDDLESDDVQTIISDEYRNEQRQMLDEFFNLPSSFTVRKDEDADTIEELDYIKSRVRNAYFCCSRS